MQSDLSHLDTLVEFAQKNWGTKALSLMSIEEITEMIQKVANEDNKQDEQLPII